MAKPKPSRDEKSVRRKLKLSRADELYRSVSRSLERTARSGELQGAHSLLRSPKILLGIPLESFGVEGLSKGEIMLGAPPLSMNELRNRLQKIADAHGDARQRAEAIEAECMASGLIQPHLREHERDALLWTRFLIDGAHDDPEEALQHVCRLRGRARNRKRATVHSSITRFYSGKGLEQPAPLDQPDRT